MSSARQALAECPTCGQSAMSSDTPCARCQPPHANHTEAGR